MKLLFWALLLLPYFCTSLAGNRNPYSVLGLSQSATKTEIQKAYRKLAKKYHPDVSVEPNAEEKFKDVAAAYEALTKEQNEPQNQQQQHHSSHRQEFNFNGQRFTFSGGPRSGGFGGSNRQKEPHKESPILTVRRFEHEVLPDSYFSVHLVKVTSRWCFLCMEYDRAWPDIIKRFKPYGLRFWELPYDTSNMKEKVSVYETPSFLVIISGRVYHFTHSLSFANIENFILAKVQSVLVMDQVNDRKVDSFVGDFTDYKVKLIFVSTSFSFPQAMAAYKYKDFYKYGFSSSEDESAKNIIQILPLPSLSGMIIFKEEYPGISRKENVRGIEQMLLIMEAEKRLLLPKISSPKIFDDLCSIQVDKPCVIFVFDSKEEFKSLRSLMQAGELQFKRSFQFSFIYRDTQFQFIESFFPPYPTSNVLLLRRTSSTHARVKWLSRWDLSDVPALYQLLKTGEHQLKGDPTKLGTIVNEHAPSLLDNIWEFVSFSSGNFFGQIHLISLNTWLSVISIITLFCVTFLINNDPEERRQPQNSSQQRSEQSTFEDTTPNSVDVPELTPDSMSVLLPSTKSQLTLLIVGDLNNNTSLPPLPVRVVSAKLHELTRKSIYSLAYVSHVKYEVWLYELAGLADSRLIQGSVIAVNFNKKYFHFFTPVNTCSNSSLVNLQDRITLWFERLCEGSLPKFTVASLQYPTC